MFLVVSAPPKFTRTPVDQTGVSGGVASFICQATGDPRPKIVWNKKGKKVSNQRFEVLGPLFCSSEKHFIPTSLLIPVCVLYYQWLSKIAMNIGDNLVGAVSLNFYFPNWLCIAPLKSKLLLLFYKLMWSKSEALWCLCSVYYLMKDIVRKLTLPVISVSREQVTSFCKRVHRADLECYCCCCHHYLTLLEREIKWAF